MAKTNALKKGLEEFKEELENDEFIVEDEDLENDEDEDDALVEAKAKEDEDEDDSDSENEDEDEEKMKEEEFDLPRKTVTKDDVEFKTDEIFEGNDFSDEFKLKAKAIFESSVIEAVNNVLEETYEAVEKDYREIRETTYKRLAEKIDHFLDLSVNAWRTDNIEALRENAEADLAHQFMSGLKTLFAENYVAIPDEKLDMVNEVKNENKTLKEQVNDMAEMLASQKRELDDIKKTTILKGFSEGLTDSEFDKLETLAESLDFDDEEEFTKNLSTLKESIFGKGKKEEGKSKLDLDDKGEQVLVEDSDDTKKDYESKDLDLINYVLKEV